MKLCFALTFCLVASFSHAGTFVSHDYEKLFHERAAEVVESTDGTLVLFLENGVSVTAKPTVVGRSYTASDNSGLTPLGCLIPGLLAELAVSRACPELTWEDRNQRQLAILKMVLAFYAEHSIPPRQQVDLEARFEVGVNAIASFWAESQNCSKINTNRFELDVALQKLEFTVAQTISVPRLPVDQPCNR